MPNFVQMCQEIMGLTKASKEILAKIRSGLRDLDELNARLAVHRTPPPENPKDSEEGPPKASSA